MTIRPSPLRVSTSIAILVFDWAVFAITLSHAQSWAHATLFGAFATALAVAVTEQWHETPFHLLMLRALLAGAVVALPLPLAGSVLALICLAWSAVARLQSAR